MYAVEHTEHTDDTLAPYRSLLVSLIRCALLDATGPCKHDRDGALRWLHNSEQRAFSFLWCCDLLGIDAEAVRHRLVVARHSVRSEIRRQNIGHKGLRNQG